MKEFITQAFGIVGFILMILSYQMKDRKKLLYMQMASNFFFVINYYMLGALTMAVMSVLNVVRSFVFSKDDTKWGSSKAWLWIFLGLAVALGIVTWEGPVSLLTITATLVLIVTLYSKNMKFMRKMFLLPPLLYVTVNLIYKSYGGLGNDIFCFISAIVAIIRFDVKKKGTENKEKTEEKGQTEK